MSRFRPSYQDDSDFTTNAESYYKDLGRKAKLIEYLAKKIYDYEETLDITLQEIQDELDDYIEIVDDKISLIDHKIGEGFNQEINTLLVDWLADGTLDHIINETIFSWKVDQTEFDDAMNSVDQQLAQIITVIHSHMSTQEIQDILDNNYRFLWKSGYYNVEPINIPSNTYHEFEGDVTLHAKEGYDLRDCLMTVSAKNVTLLFNGAILKMRKEDYTTGEHRHCLNITQSENVYYENVELRDSGGDGVYIGNSTSISEANKNIVGNNIRAINHKRQGVSITNVSHLRLNNLYIEDVIGTPPAYGIDIEPNNPSDKMEDILISNIKTKNCDGGGILIALKFLASNPNTPVPDNFNNEVDITIENFESLDDKIGIYMPGSPLKIGGKIKFIKTNVSESYRQGVQISSWYEDYNPQVIFEELKIKNPNHEINPSSLIGSGFVMNGGSLNRKIGGVTLNDYEITDDRPVKRMNRGLYVVNSTSPNNAEITLGNSLGVSGAIDNDMSIFGVFNVDNKKKKKTLNVTSSTAVNLGGSNETVEKVTNEGATSDLSVLLGGVVGNVLEIEVKENHLIRVRPTASGNVLHPDIVGGGTKNIQSDVVGSTLTVKKVTESSFIVEQQTGVWEIV